MPAEFDFINWIRQQQTASPLAQLPAGDDMAVLKWPADELLLVAVDQVLDTVHFDSKTHSPLDIGKKVMNRNLSDCAAMACRPVCALACVALPHGVGLEYAKSLYTGIRQAGELFGCSIVGGETGSWNGKLALSVTIFGRSAGVAPITRSGARPGQSIYVTGPLGGSILGRHMTFEPRVELGIALARTGTVSAMIDLSDGLSRDLAHIAQQSKVGALIYADLIPIHDDVRRLPPDNRQPIDHALNDGEDYELLFTSDCAPDQWPQRFPNLPVHFVGTTTPTPALEIEIAGNRQPLQPRAWEHQL